MVVAFPLSLALWYFGRKRAQFKWWELSAFVLPFIVWLVLSALSSKNKGLWSPMVEVFILGCTVPVAALIRVIVGRAVNRNLMAGSLLFVICVLAIPLGIMIPKIEFQPFVK
jgi:nitrate/nitrite transporter NarK